MLRRWVTARHKWLSTLVLLLLTAANIQFIPLPAGAANSNSTTSCGPTGTGVDLGDLVVTPLHGKAFYTDLKNGVNATYVGYSVTNQTSSNLDNIWVSLDNFRAVSGVSVLNIANAADSNQPVLPSDPGTMPVGRIIAGGTSYVYFLIKATDVSTFAQRHDVRIYRGNQSEGGVSYGSNYNCYYEFAGATRTLAASANKVTSISVDSANPKLGSVVTVTVNGATGVGGAGDSTMDADAMWLSPASVSTWPTRALRLETTKLTVKYKKQDNSTKWDVFNNTLLIKNVGCSSPCTTAFKSGTTYVAEFKFRIIGSASSDPAVKPVAQIASGTQMKHTSTYPSTISLIPIVNPPKSVTVTKAIDPTYTINKVGNNWLTKYKVTITNGDTSDVVVDEVIDYPSSSVTLLPNSVAYIDKYRTSSTTLNPSPTSKDAYGKYHFVGPFTVAASGTATVTYIMQLPAPTSGSVTYTNQAFGQVGPTLIGASTSSTVVTQCPITFNSDGTINTSTSCNDVPPEKQPQEITFNQPPSQGAGTSYSLDATSTSGLTVTYSIVSGPCSISANQVNYNAEGSCVIRASQTGDTSYLAATPVDRTVTILPAQVINFGSTASMTTNSSQTVTVTASSGLYVTLTTLDSSICMVGNASGTPALSYTAIAADNNLFKITTYANKGNCPLVATQLGNATYGAAVQVDRLVPVGLSVQVLTTEPTAPSSSYTLTQATAGVDWNVAARIGTSSGTKISTNPITYTSKTPAVCLAGDAVSTSSGGTFQYFKSTIVASTAGLCIIQADQDGFDINSAQSAYSAADPLTISFTIGATPTVSVSATSAVKSNTNYTGTVTITKPAGVTLALSGTIKLFSTGNFTSAVIQSTSVSLDTATNSQTLSFTITSDLLPPASASGSIELFATFTTGNSSYNNSQTLSNAVTTVYSPVSLTISPSSSWVYTGRQVTATVSVQGNAAYGSPTGSVILTINGGGSSSPASAVTLTSIDSSTSRATFTLTAAWDPLTDIVVDASYTPSTPSTTYFNSLANSFTQLSGRTVDVQSLPNHTVTFHANLGSGNMADQVTNTTANLNANTFARLGYSFSNWSTAADGTGVNYNDGASFAFTSDLDLYAIWTPLPNHTVEFRANGGSGTMANQVSNIAWNLTSNSFTRSGYSFTGWNTAANGSGTSYSNNESYAFSSNLILYAMWQALPNHTVTFSANGGTGSMANQVANVSSSLSTNTFSREGYSFTGWNSLSDGSGSSFNDADTYSFNADLNLYAQWFRNSYSVEFRANGGSGTMASQTANTASNLRTNAFTYYGYSFSGWNTQSNGSGTSYADQANIPFTANLVLYAIWQPLPSHSVTFMPNGGMGSMGLQTNNVTASLSPNSFTREGYSFARWNTEANGTGISYLSSDTHSFDSDLTLYAQWSRNTYTVEFRSNTGAGTMASQSAASTTALNANTFSKYGHSFSNWNTAPDGTGNSYQDRELFGFTTNLVLFAIWQDLPSHTVIFMPNGGSGSMGNQVSNVASNLSSNSFLRDGYSFTGWNTEANGSGVRFLDQDSFEFTVDETLYAQWSRNSYTVTFHINDASGIDQVVTQISASTTSLRANTFSRKGYSFTGWNTQALGIGSAFANQESYGFVQNLVVYAQWSRNSYTVTFHNNDESGIDSTSQQTSSATEALATNLFVRSGFSFAGWTTVSDGSGTNYSNAANYDFLENLELFAQWRALGTNDVIFDSNGGTGSMLRQQSFAAQNLHSNTFTRHGFFFQGWNTRSDGLGTAFADGENFDFQSSITVYAQWLQLEHTVTFDPNFTGPATYEQRSANPDTLQANSYTRAGYRFTGWTTESDGTGLTYSNQQSYGFIDDLTLFAGWERLPFTATFWSNTTSNTALRIQTESTSAHLNAPTTPVRDHFEFLGWNTSDDGTGLDVIDGQDYSFLSDIDIYAIWAPLYTVTFDVNSASGQAGVESTEQAVSGAQVLTSTKGTMFKHGFGFLGWSRTQDSTTADFVTEEALTPESDFTLYAVWERQSFTVNFKYNYGEQVNDDISTQSASSTTALSNPTPTRERYRITEWNTDASGLGTTYADGIEYDFLDNLTLYAIWERATFTAKFKANFGTNPNQDLATQTESETANLQNPSPTREHYALTGWNTLSDGSGTSYSDSQSFDFLESLTLYAQWQRLLTANFNTNGGTGAPEYSSKEQATPSSTIKLPTVSEVTRTGYRFAGWSTTQSATSATFEAGEDVTPTVDGETFYAVWIPIPVVTQGINGLAWLDFNGDGIQQAGEPNLPGLSLDIDQNTVSSSLRGAAVTRQAVTPLVTNGLGRYGLSVNAGTWLATIAVPQVLSITQTSAGARTAMIVIEVPAGQTAEVWVGLNSSTLTGINAKVFTKNGTLVTDPIQVKWDGIDGKLKTFDDVTFDIPISNGAMFLNNLPAGQYQILKLGNYREEISCIGFRIQPSRIFTNELHNFACNSLAFTGSDLPINWISSSGLGLIVIGGLLMTSKRRRRKLNR